MRQDGTLYYLLMDHLGSTSITTDASGVRIAELRYDPWGEVRYTWGTQVTDYTYTGQRSEVGSFGLMYYRARWYEPALGRFTQADTIVPEATQGTQAWDRFAYVNNNPIRYNDPSGHCIVICIAAALIIGGAAIGGGTYAITNQGDNFDAKEFAVATVTGAVGGALIATGVGAGASIATIAAVGAGTGALSSQVGYTIAAGDQYNTSSMLISASVGGLAGAATSAIGAPFSTMGTSMQGVVAKIGVEITASVTQYAATERYVYDRDITWTGIRRSAGYGLIVGASNGLFDELFPSSSQQFADNWMRTINNKNTSRSLRRDLLEMYNKISISDSIFDAFRSGATETLIEKPSNTPY